MMIKLSGYRYDAFQTILNQLWRIVSGPLLLVSIPYFLTPETQGYWYTFISLAAFSVLADLGFSNIILQFSAHEFAFLHFNEKMELEGDWEHQQKLTDFFWFSLRWLLKIVLVVFPLIIIGGYFFISYKATSSISTGGWKLAWVIYALASAFVFMNSIILSFFEGCNLVGKVQKLRFNIAVATTATMFLGLVFHLNLYALAMSNVISSLVGLYLIYRNFKYTIYQLLKMKEHAVYDWWPEFSALIWRYAISWGSGFMVFQLFTPMTFYFYGPVAAGKVGISIAMWTAGFNIAISWITAITPKMNMLIAQKRWQALDDIFFSGLAKSFSTMLAGGICFFLLEFLLYSRIAFFHRILEPLGMFILFVAWLLQVIVNSLAIYLRAHKKEPLVKISCINAVIVVVGTLLCGKFLDAQFLFCGFLIGSFIQCPAVYHVFCLFRKQHNLYNGVKL
ncbi:hypothetical protein [uncultured Megasphaera sp.]|uniref:hypothetical protein n=1 Tax=uncultured Megasphaera sp. TaxID=165188 RepID=UPI00266CB1D7|nr:hypothetical protein [uncultured Megasphaera sp.]